MSRHGNRWTVNEILTLQREYELLELTVKQIAFRHQRSEDAILMKLEAEGFLQEGPFVEIDSININLEDLYEDETQLERIYKLECAVEEVTNVVKELVKRFYSSSSSSSFSPKKTSKLYL
jgi:sulfite reductase alpha subunit-like flavoprotein